MKFVERGVKLIPVAGAVDIERGELQRLIAGGDPTHGIVRATVIQKDGSVPRHPQRELGGWLALHGDDVALQASLLDAALKDVAAVFEIDLLAIQILNVEAQVGDAPGDAAIVAR